MLITKFKMKYGNKPTLNKFIDNEVQKFLANDRLTEANLKGLDTKIGREADNRDKKSAILSDMRSQRSQSAYSQKSAAPSVKSRGGLSAAALSTLNKNNDKKSQGALSIKSRGVSASGYARSKQGDMMSYASS